MSRLDITGCRLKGCDAETMTRREFFNWGLNGLGATALASLLPSQLHAAASKGGRPMFPAKAKRAVNICLVGGLSQVDSFDYKPELARFHGKKPPLDIRPDVFFGKVGPMRKHDWAFRQHGQSGLWVSALFPCLSTVIDDLTVIRSMVSDTGNHTPALFLHNSGFPVNGFPSLGSWLSYGLGNISEDLPTFVVLADARGAPSGGSSSWTSGFLPAQHQGVQFQTGKQPVRDLFPPEPVAPGEQSAVGELLAYMQQRQLRRLGGHDDVLVARLRSYELAARMQSAVPEANDLGREPESVKRLYGLDSGLTKDFARTCILARRLLERGVRFVQLYSGGPLGGTPRTSWDAHEDMITNHQREAGRIDQPVAALLVDLKRRGMLEDTLVTITTEFGRTPFSQTSGDKVSTGRDHNHAGFTVLMAGAGLKPGMAHGNTDEIGFAAVDNPVTWHDFHATILHLFGLDHEKLTYYHSGIQRRLTNVHGHVVSELLRA